MKIQNLKIVMVICVMAIFTNVSAQKLSKKAAETVKQDVAEMSDVMQLSDEQAQQILELKTSLRLSNQKAIKIYEKNSQELKEARKANMKQYNASLRKVCTKEQLAIWQKHKKSRRSK